jgi:soluble lytic murein transglycosylase-like protein
MSINPASISDVSAYAREPYFVEDAAAPAPLEDEMPHPNTAQGGLSTQLQSGIDALERRFTAFTQALTKELESLERKFSVALRSMTGAAKRADSAVTPYDGIIKRAAARNGVDPALVGALVRHESGFRTDAVSPAGAKGLMQLMPATAKDLGVEHPFDARENVEGGTRLLRGLIDRYDGRLDLALAAYNAGPAAVDRYGGVPPYPETRAYVQAIMADYRTAALQSS